MDSITLGILYGENYNNIRVLTDLFVMLEYPTRGRQCQCRGMVAVITVRLPECLTKLSLFITVRFQGCCAGIHQHCAGTRVIAIA